MDNYIKQYGHIKEEDVDQFSYGFIERFFRSPVMSESYMLDVYYRKPEPCERCCNLIIINQYRMYCNQCEIHQ